MPKFYSCLAMSWLTTTTNVETWQCQSMHKDKAKSGFHHIQYMRTDVVMKKNLH